MEGHVAIVIDNVSVFNPIRRRGKSAVDWSRNRREQNKLKPNFFSPRTKWNRYCIHFLRYLRRVKRTWNIWPKLGKFTSFLMIECVMCTAIAEWRYGVSGRCMAETRWSRLRREKLYCADSNCFQLVGMALFVESCIFNLNYSSKYFVSSLFLEVPKTK